MVTVAELFESSAVTVGVPYANRPFAELARTVGNFVNVLPIVVHEVGRLDLLSDGRRGLELAEIQHADLMAEKNVLPQWDEEGKGCDMYYWYYGSYAMFQMGNKYGNHWKKWNAALKPTLLDNQRQDGDFKGSWNPVGPWGYSGGRVYSTAIGALCLEVYFRYSQILGAR